MKQRDHYRQILRLASGIARLANPQHLAVLDRERLSLTQFLVLDALDAAGVEQRMSELAHGAGLPATELTRVVDGLEKRGWISRVVDSRDGRARLVSLTRAGTRSIRTVHRKATAELRSVWDDFTHDEWHRFVDLLQRFETGIYRVRSRRPSARGARRRQGGRR